MGLSISPRVRNTVRGTVLIGVAIAGTLALSGCLVAPGPYPYGYGPPAYPAYAYRPAPYYGGGAYYGGGYGYRYR